jgi:hypothetical protein
MQALKEYKDNGTRPIVPPDSKSNDYAVWQCVFENIPEMYNDLVIQESQEDASFALNNYLEQDEKGKKSIIGLITMCLYAKLKLHNDSDKQLCEDISKTWIEIFEKAGFKKEFVESLEANKARFPIREIKNV